jgi:hypothetical protein
MTPKEAIKERRHRVQHVDEVLDELYWEFDVARNSRKAKSERKEFMDILARYGDHVAGRISEGDLQVVEIQCIS